MEILDILIMCWVYFEVLHVYDFSDLLCYFLRSLPV